MTSDAVTRLTDLLGTACVRFLLGLDYLHEDHVAAVDLSADQLTVIEQLNRALPDDPDEFRLRLQVADMLGRFDAAIGSSWGAHARQVLTADYAVGQSDDPVLSSMLPQLRDVFPAMLMPPSHKFGGFEIASALHSHPLREKSQDAILEDHDLGLLFPNETESQGRLGDYLGPESAGSIQLWNFTDQMLSVAFDWARFEAVPPTFERVAAKLGELLEIMRRSARGETVKVPVRVSLSGVLLPEGTSHYEFGAATIRPRDGRDSWIASRTGLEGALASYQEDSGEVEISYAGDVVVETTMDFRVFLRSFDIDEEWPAELSSLRRSVENQIESIRLGLILATGPDNPVLVLEAWTLVLDPFASGRSVRWREIGRSHKLTPVQLSQQEVADWRRWADLVEANDLSRVEVAVRRLLQAIGEREMLDDVLIDSVTAWESIFGVKQETMFRVCGSLAWLLGHDVASRKEWLSELKRIYDVRSRVVHGSAVLDPRQHAVAIRALSIGVEVLRVILRDRPDLLTETDGAARSGRLIMGD